MRVGPELKWVLEGFTPDTIPMSRLAQYMQELSKLFGEEPSVHFVRVEDNCVALVSRVDGSAAGKVSARVRGVRDGGAPADALRSFDALNAMLANDNTTAYLKEGAAVVIRFPGKKAEQTPALEVPDTGSVVGYLYMLIDAGKAYHARIRLESGGTLMCTVHADMAKRLREHLFEPVKVYGTGIWARNAGGTWTATSLDINDVVRADASKLRAVVDDLRKLEIDWPDDPLGMMDEINREGDTIQ